MKLRLTLSSLVALTAVACTPGDDIRASGATKAAQSLTQLAKLYDGLRAGNGTNAQGALIELARLPGGLAAMLLRPLDISVGGATTRTLEAAASFPECASLSRSGTCDAVTLSDCAASGFTATGSGQGCDDASCAGGKVYGGTFNVSLSSAAASGTFGITATGLCLTPASANGATRATVSLQIPSVGATDMILDAKAENITFGATGPTGGKLTVFGSGTFVGGPIGGCVVATFDGTRGVAIATGVVQGTAPALTCNVNHL